MRWSRSKLTLFVYNLLGRPLIPTEAVFTNEQSPTMSRTAAQLFFRRSEMLLGERMRQCRPASNLRSQPATQVLFPRISDGGEEQTSSTGSPTYGSIRIPLRLSKSSHTVTTMHRPIDSMPIRLSNTCIALWCSVMSRLAAALWVHSASIDIALTSAVTSLQLTLDLVHVQDIHQFVE
jgi:hypothetical protein